MGGVFTPKINGLVSYVRWHPGAYPGYNGDGRAVLAGALGRLLDVQIDYYAQVDLGGFVHVVDSIGGIIVDVDHGMCDANYDEYGYEGSHFSIGAGRHHMNGETRPSRYARIRKSAGESDFTRAARQQQVVVAIRNKVVWRRLPRRPDRLPQGGRRHGPDQHPAEDPAGPRAAGASRSRARTSTRPSSATRWSTRAPCRTPAVRSRSRTSRRSRPSGPHVPGAGHDPRRQVPRPDAHEDRQWPGRPGAALLEPAPDAEADAQADPEAHAQAEQVAQPEPERQRARREPAAARAVGRPWARPRGRPCYPSEVLGGRSCEAGVPVP